MLASSAFLTFWIVFRMDCKCVAYQSKVLNFPEHPEVLEEQAKKNTDLAKMLEGLVVAPEKFGEVCNKEKSSDREISVNHKKLNLGLIHILLTQRGVADFCVQVAYGICIDAYFFKINHSQLIVIYYII